MKRSDIARTLQVKFNNMRARDADALVNLIIDKIIESVKNGNTVQIRGFGSFEARTHSAKMRFNPNLGKHVMAPARRVILFRPSKNLIQGVN